MEKLIVADSGGSKTEWIIQKGSKCIQLKSSSLHPNNLTLQKLDELRALFKDFNLNKYRLILYGAGCMATENADKLKKLLRTVGFPNVLVYSDVLGSCIACLGNQKGSILILGTGSVAADFDGEKITQLYGGRGYEFGDEGSGYHLGKLLLKSYSNNELEENLEKSFEFFLIKNNIQVPLIEDGTKRKKTSELSPFILNNKKNEKVYSIIQKSFEQLYNTTLKNLNYKSIHCTGSVAYYYQNELSSYLITKNIEVQNTVQYPALTLYKWHLNQSKVSHNQ